MWSVEKSHPDTPSEMVKQSELKDSKKKKLKEAKQYHTPKEPEETLKWYSDFKSGQI